MVTTIANLPDHSIVASGLTVYMKTFGVWSSAGIPPARDRTVAEWVDTLLQSGDATVLRVGAGA